MSTLVQKPVADKHFNTPMDFFNEALNVADSSSHKSDIKDVIKLFESGNTENENKFLAYQQKMGLKFLSQAMNNMQYEVYGDYVDVDRYLSGEPECMVSYEAIQEEAKKFQNIEIRYAYPDFALEGNNNLHYYACVLSIIDEMESKGIRCKISIACDYLNKHQTRRGNFTINIKDYSEPLELKSLCNLVLSKQTSAAARALNVDKLKTGNCAGIDMYLKMPTYEDRDGVETLCFPSLWAVARNDYSRGFPLNYSKEFLVSYLGLKMD